MQIKTVELDGVALDWAVAKALHCDTVPQEVRGTPGFRVESVPPCILQAVSYDGLNFKPSSDWSQGGPLIEHYRVNLLHEAENYWQADPCVKNGIYLLRYNRQYGKTPLIAAMRAIVALELGDFVEVTE